MRQIPGISFVCLSISKIEQKKLGINTASNYYRKFRGLLAIALRDKLLTKDINTSLTRIEPKRNRIEFLTQQELYNLSNAHCRFLFSNGQLFFVSYRLAVQRRQRTELG